MHGVQTGLNFLAVHPAQFSVGLKQSFLLMAGYINEVIACPPLLMYFVFSMHNVTKMYLPFTFLQSS